MGGHEMDPAVLKHADKMLGKSVRGSHATLIDFDEIQTDGLIKYDVPVPYEVQEESEWWKNLRERSRVYPEASVSHDNRKRLDRVKANGGNALPILRRLGLR